MADHQRQRLYRAEQADDAFAPWSLLSEPLFRGDSAWANRRDRTNAELDRLGRMVTATDWWQHLVADSAERRVGRIRYRHKPASLRPQLTVRLSPLGSRNASGGWYGTTGYTAAVAPNTWAVSGFVLAHEIAHAAHYLWSAIPYAEELSNGDGGHGPDYAGFFLAATELCLDAETRDALAERFGEHRVKHRPCPAQPAEDRLIARWARDVTLPWFQPGSGFAVEPEPTMPLVAAATHPGAQLTVQLAMF